VGVGPTLDARRRVARGDGERNAAARAHLASLAEGMLADSVRRQTQPMQSYVPRGERPMTPTNASPDDPELPPWVVLHVPHDSTLVPDAVRDQFLLSDAELQHELLRMTDQLTHAIFAAPPCAAAVVRAPVSRLVVDVERFEDDANEPMAERGMGAVYTTTSASMPLRRPLAADEREALLRDWYRPHHARLEAAVADALAAHGQCLVIDCHSFPSEALPYERAEPRAWRPDICIGTDAFHTHEWLAESFLAAFEEAGWRVARDTPFSGAIVPASRYRQDARVAAVMVELRRGLYLDEAAGTPLPGFEAFARRVREACVDALDRPVRGGLRADRADCGPRL